MKNKILILGIMALILVMLGLVMSEPLNSKAREQSVNIFGFITGMILFSVILLFFYSKGYFPLQLGRSRENFEELLKELQSTSIFYVQGGEIPPSFWSKSNLTLNIKKAYERGVKMKFIGEETICIGQRKGNGFTPSKFLKTILQKSIQLYKKPGKEQSLHGGHWHYRIVDKRAFAHCHNDRGGRIYYDTTNKRYINDFIEEMDKKIKNGEVVKFDINKCKEEGSLVVEIDDDMKYNYANENEIKEFEEILRNKSDLETSLSGET